MVRKVHKGLGTSRIIRDPRGLPIIEGGYITTEEDLLTIEEVIPITGEVPMEDLHITEEDPTTEEEGVEEDAEIVKKILLRITEKISRNKKIDKGEIPY